MPLTKAQAADLLNDFFNAGSDEDVAAVMDAFHDARACHDNGSPVLIGAKRAHVHGALNRLFSNARSGIEHADRPAHVVFSENSGEPFRAFSLNAGTFADSDSKELARSIPRYCRSYTGSIYVCRIVEALHYEKGELRESESYTDASI